jgi:hypothetical protein
MPATTKQIAPSGVEGSCIVKKRLAQKMMPGLSLLRPQVAALFFLFFILVCPTPSHATLGVMVTSKDGVVIGIDSRITGGRHPGLNCKVVQQGNIVVIASGTFDFLVDPNQFEFWDEARKVLAQPASIKDTAAALDARIEPLLQSGLNTLYNTRRYYYRLHYRKRSVLEFIVVGTDEKGLLSAYHYRYMARTPAEFSSVKHEILPADSPEPRVEEIPFVNDYAVFKPGPGNTISQIADQIVEFIDAAKEQFPDAGIGDPITTVFVDKHGVKFLNPGKCTSK